ncbi:21414_t:CDS:2, partial [Dentiscutata erythropus]
PEPETFLSYIKSWCVTIEMELSFMKYKAMSSNDNPPSGTQPIPVPEKPEVNLGRGNNPGVY